MSVDAEVSPGCAFVDLSPRAKVSMSGADAVSHLHKFCTNDIVNLPVGQGCEAFVLDAKGQIQFYALVHRRADGLLLELPAAEFETDAAARLMKFLGKYVIVEKVLFADETDELGELWIGGPDAPALLADALQVAPPEKLLEAIDCPAVGDGAWLVRSTQGEQTNYTLFGRPEQLDVAQVRLSASGITEREFAWYDAARIGAGVPLLGRDISEKTLPQEINRNAQTLNFRKGCYLGQETVARLDAMGHVNKALLRLQAEAGGDAGAAATLRGDEAVELRVGDQVVGRLSSLARDAAGTVVALGMVRVAMNQPGTKLTSDRGTFVVR
ncbi:MAG: hypothetical protein C0483_16040 [Pirellula sp.]|nr:hypothetical protein [Pirellula sp.]